MTAPAPTLSTHDLIGLRAYRRRPRKGEPDAVKKLGKVHACVFHPREARCVGLLVKRPDAALMFKRGDAFVALGRCERLGDALLVSDDADAMDEGACKALGIDLDECVLWVGMPLVVEDGTALGLVGSVDLDARTGAVQAVRASQGATANALLGQRVVAAEDILGFRKIPAEGAPGAILVSAAALERAAEGGAAEAAGKTTAVVAAKAKRVASTAKPKASAAAQAAGDAAGKAAYATGRQLGRASGMFAAFKEEHDRARRGHDED